MLHLSLALQEEHASGPLTVEGGLMFWTIVVFLLLLLILKRFAWPAILGAVEAREKALEEQLAEAERNRAEAAKLLAEHKKLVGDARAQARAILARGPIRGRQGACGGAREDEARAGGAAGAGPARDRRGA